MGKILLREENTCLNCGYKVDESYCTHCGQENTESRKTFGHLVTHFAEDLTHYDNAFWKTIKYLLFRPSRLTREYLIGRRKSFVPPIKLYIFINFITFFLLTAIPSDSEKQYVNKIDGKKVPSESYQYNHEVDFGNYKSVTELDSIQRSLPESERLSSFRYWMERKATQIAQKNINPEDYAKKVMTSFMNNLPKVLFIYMPIFALVLWLFHGKKRYFYFDYAIFTLHYFCFVLLTFSCFLILESVTHFLNEIINAIALLTIIPIVIWWIIYFFRSHRLMYSESWLVSAAKGIVVLTIDVVFILFLMIVALVYSALNM